jgi:hypothetical protein
MDEAARRRFTYDQGLALVPGLLEDLQQTESDVRGRWRIVQDEHGNGVPYGSSRRLEILKEDTP